MKKDNNNDDNGYNYEERDDERTFGEGITSDLEKIEKEKIQKAKAHQRALEYVEEFQVLIKACGKVSYFNNMQFFVRRNVTKAKDVASSYNHDVHYYDEQLNEWKAKAEKSFDTLKYKASLIGYDIEEPKKEFLGNLQLWKKKRECYKYYLSQFESKGKLFSPDELEIKFINRINKPKKKK